jgi:hypothetical protein
MDKTDRILVIIIIVLAVTLMNCGIYSACQNNENQKGTEGEVSYVKY